MERIPPSYSDRWLGERIDGMEVEVGGEARELHVRSTPAGRNSIPRGDYEPLGAVDHGEGFAPPADGQALVRGIGERCQGNSACVPICPIQAKYNALKTLTKAVAAGGVTVQTQLVASRVLTEGRRVNRDRVPALRLAGLPRRTRPRLPEAAPTCCLPRGRERQADAALRVPAGARGGRRLPAGPPGGAALGPRAGADRCLPRAALYLGDRGSARRRIPRQARRLPGRDRQRRLALADGLPGHQRGRRDRSGAVRRLPAAGAAGRGGQADPGSGCWSNSRPP